MRALVIAILWSASLSGERPRTAESSRSRIISARLDTTKGAIVIAVQPRLGAERRGSVHELVTSGLL